LHFPHPRPNSDQESDAAQDQVAEALEQGKI
jgi:hypothetical protein